MLQQPPVPATIRLPSDNELTRLERVHGRLWTPDCEEPGLKCPTCLGKHTYRWWPPGPRLEVVQWECRCDDQFTLHRYFLSRGLGPAEMRLDWADMKSIPPPLVKFTLDYFERVEAYVTNGLGAVLVGGHGTGKSSVAHLFLRKLMSEGYDGYFIRFKAFLDQWRGLNYGHGSEEDRAWFTKRVLNAQVLVIDDLGQEYTGVQTRKLQADAAKAGAPIDAETDAANRLEDLLRLRNSLSRPTFLTTNLSSAEIGIRYGRSVMEMITERSIVCEVPGANFREAFSARTREEMLQGLSRPIVVG